MSDLTSADHPGEPAAEIERHASWAELFFDLVVVAGVAALASEQQILDVKALGLYAGLFLAFWLSWTTFMLYGNIAAGQTHIVRLMFGMFGLGVMAASVPGVTEAVLEDGGVRPMTVFAAAYIATRIYGGPWCSTWPWWCWAIWLSSAGWRGARGHSGTLIRGSVPGRVSSTARWACPSGPLPGGLAVAVDEAARTVARACVAGSGAAADRRA